MHAARRLPLLAVNVVPRAAAPDITVTAMIMSRTLFSLDFFSSSVSAEVPSSFFFGVRFTHATIMRMNEISTITVVMTDQKMMDFEKLSICVHCGCMICTANVRAADIFQI